MRSDSNVPGVARRLAKTLGATSSKRARSSVMESKKRPKTIPTLWQFHSMGIGRTNGLDKKYKVIPARGGGSDAKFGHKVHKVQVNNLRRGRIQTAWLCSACNAISLSDSLRRKCSAKITRRSLSFWKHLKNEGQLEETLKIAGSPVLTDWVHQILGIEEEKFFGHD